MKLLLKGHGVQIPFPEIPGVKLWIVFFDPDEGRKQPRTNIIVLFGYRAAADYFCIGVYSDPFNHNFELWGGHGVMFSSDDPMNNKFVIESFMNQCLTISEMKKA